MVFRFILTTVFCAFVGGAVRLQPGVAARRTTSLQQYLYSTERLKVMTWNVGRARLGGDDSLRWEDLPHIAEVIAREKPDVAALQELASDRQASALARRLRDGYNMWAMGTRGGLAVLVRRRHRVRDAFPLPAGNGRQALAVVFERVRIKEPILVATLHADPFDARARRHLVEDVVAQTRGRNGHTFLVGDFNLDVWGDADKRRGNNTLTERLTNDAESYSLLTRHFTDLGKAAAATALMQRRLDYVFARPRNTVAVKAQVLLEARGEMDHQPLLVHVDLLAKPRLQLGN